MDGSYHYSKAEELAAKAEEYLRQGDGQAAAWAALAQVHATLAGAAAHEPDYGDMPSLPPKPEPFILTAEDGTSIEVTPEMRRAAVRDAQMRAKYGYTLEDDDPWPDTAPGPESENDG